MLVGHKTEEIQLIGDDDSLVMWCQKNNIKFASQHISVALTA